jgi:hypothetical protein
MSSWVRSNRYPDWATPLRLPLISCLGLLLAQTACAEGCAGTLLHTYNRVTLYVRALRIDKPGQMHVVATDGAIYTAGEVWWLRGQLRTVAQACVAGRNEIAATRLVDVQSILQSHQAHLPE